MRRRGFSSDVSPYLGDWNVTTVFISSPELKKKLIFLKSTLNLIKMSVNKVIRLIIIVIIVTDIGSGHPIEDTTAISSSNESIESNEVSSYFPWTIL